MQPGITTYFFPPPLPLLILPPLPHSLCPFLLSPSPSIFHLPLPKLQRLVSSNTTRDMQYYSPLSSTALQILSFHRHSMYIYYCTSGRAVQENIWFKAGSILFLAVFYFSHGRANTEAENWIFFCTARPKECDNIFIIWPSTSFFELVFSCYLWGVTIMFSEPRSFGFHCSISPLIEAF